MSYELHISKIKMDYATILGLAAATFTTGAFLPQVIKAWKTKSTKDVSLAMFAMLCIGILLWLAYGFLIGSIPVIAANAVSFILNITVIALKIKYK